MRTLAEMNEKTREWERNGMVLSSEFAVGRVGRYQTGQKLHLLRIERVVSMDAATVSPHNRYHVGDVFSAGALCNGNGQHIGQLVKGLDTDAVTCKKCGG